MKTPSLAKASRKQENLNMKTINKKSIFNFVSVTVLITACAIQPQEPVIDNSQQTQNSGKQPSISLAQTAEASETTEDMRTPTAAPPIGSIQTTPEQPTVNERLKATLKAPSQASMRGTTILEETAAGTYVHVQAQGLDPKSSYNLSLYDKADCNVAQLGRTPTSRPQRVLAKLPISSKGNIKFSQFFEGLKVKGESGITNNSIILTENNNQATSITNQNTRISAGCFVLNN